MTKYFYFVLKSDKINLNNKLSINTHTYVACVVEIIKLSYGTEIIIVYVFIKKKIYDWRVEKMFILIIENEIKRNDFPNYNAFMSVQ